MSDQTTVNSIGFTFILTLLAQSLLLEFLPIKKWKWRAKWYQLNIAFSLLFSVVVMAMLCGPFFLTGQKIDSRPVQEIDANQAMAEIASTTIQTNLSSIKALLLAAKTNGGSYDTNTLGIDVPLISSRFAAITNALTSNALSVVPESLTRRVHDGISDLPISADNARTNASTYVRAVEDQLDVFGTLVRALQYHTIRYAAFFIFFFGIIRVLAEFISDRIARRSTLLTDSLIMALILAVITDRFFPEKYFHAILDAPITSLRGIAGYIICVAIYLLWIYQIVFNRLTKGEDFGRRFVHQFMRKPLPLEVPMQAVLIGSKDAGKTRIFCSATGKPYKSAATTESESGKCPTIDVDGTSVSIGLIDTPGEHLGTHLAAALNFRTDHLAIAINSEALNLGELKRLAVDNLEVFASRAFASSASGIEARNYWLALDYSTRRHPGQAQPAQLSLRTLYKVRTLSIFVYVVPTSPSVDVECVASLNRVAALLADRFEINATDGQRRLGVEVFPANAQYEPNGLAVVRAIGDYVRTLL